MIIDTPNGLLTRKLADALARAERAEADNAALAREMERLYKDTGWVSTGTPLAQPHPGAALLARLAAAEAFVKHMTDDHEPWDECCMIARDAYDAYDALEVDRG